MCGAKTKGAGPALPSLLTGRSLELVHSSRCGNEDRSRCAADLYRPLQCFMSRAAGQSRAKQGRAGQGSVALSDSTRGPRGTLVCEERTTSSIADRSQVQGSTRTDSLWSYTRGYTWATLGLCNAQLLCNGWCRWGNFEKRVRLKIISILTIKFK